MSLFLLNVLVLLQDMLMISPLRTVSLCHAELVLRAADTGDFTLWNFGLNVKWIQEKLGDL